MRSLLLILLAAVTYTNPILYADYSDPDAIRVGEDYYMTSSSFNCFPGLQILHSKDLVNWSIVNAALPKSYVAENGVEHGNLVWAPSIRFHNDRYYIFWGDPDHGLYYVSAEHPEHRWTEPRLILEGKGLIDPCPLWQGDTLFVVHALAGSRAGLKSVLMMATMKMENDDYQLIDHRIVFDGHANNPTCEGPKIYCRNGWYYVFTPAGGVSTGWQLVLRSRNIYGPYESKIVLSQGDTDIKGPHQGAWVTTPSGEDWFLHFQDVGALGRIVHLQPMRWVDDWPLVGNNGQPVRKHQAPEGCKAQIRKKSEQLNFEDSQLDFSWQYQHSPDPKWHFCDAANGVLRLYSYPETDGFINLISQPNMLLRKMDAPQFTATARVRFFPSERLVGERAGLVVMGLDYAGLMIEKSEEGIVLYQVQCQKAEKANLEKRAEVKNISENQQWLYLRLQVKDGQASFAYSLDGKHYVSFADRFTLREGLWIGAKYGFVCTRPNLKNLKVKNDGGWLDIDWMKIDY